MIIRSHLEERVLRLTRQRNPSVDFGLAVGDGGRCRLENAIQAGAPYTDVNLVLSELRVVLVGKAANVPGVKLEVHTRWALTKYDLAFKIDSTRNMLPGRCKSEKYSLSEWLVDEGALLKRKVDHGLEMAMRNAFAPLGGGATDQAWPGSGPHPSASEDCIVYPYPCFFSLASDGRDARAVITTSWWRSPVGQGRFARRVMRSAQLARISHQDSDFWGKLAKQLGRSPA